MAAEAAAPAAASSPPPPSGKQQASFDMRLSLAKSLGTPRAVDAPAETPPPAQAGENVDEPESGQPVDPPGEETESEGSEEAPAGDDPGSAEGGEARSEKEQLEAVTKAFEAGDIEAMAAALKKAGQQVSGPVKRAFRAYQRRQQKLEADRQSLTERERAFEDSRARAQQTIADDSRRVSMQERQLIQRFGWAHALQEAWESEDMTTVGKMLERGCKGATLATITQKLATGKQGKTPEEKKLAEDQKAFDEKKAAEERKSREAEEQKTQAQKREAAVARTGEALKNHPYLATKNQKGETVVDAEALAEVFEAYERSWNGEKFTKTARKCADELQEKLEARAKARGLAPAPPPPKTPKPNGKKPPVRAPAGKEPPRTPSPNRGSAADLEASRAMRIANAKRITEMQRRGVVR